MASILNSGTWNNGTASSSHAVSLPTVTAGALLVVVFCQSVNRSYTGVTAGWNHRGSWAMDVGSILSNAYLFTKVSSGSETSMTVSFNNTNTASAHCYVIDCDYYSYQGTTSNGLTNTVNPPQATTSGYVPSTHASQTWTAGTSTLFLAVGCADTRNKSTNISGWNPEQSYNAGGAGQPGIWGFSKTSTAREDPGTFTLSGTSRWAALTMGFWDLTPTQQATALWFGYP